MSTETPSELLCSLTKMVMQDPVLTICGHAFDRPAIEKWFVAEDCCPHCRRVLSLKELLPAQSVLSQLTIFQLEKLRGVLPGSGQWLDLLGAMVNRELRRCEMQDMRLFLEANSLGAHFDALVRNGFLTLTALTRLREVDCLKAGLDRLQRATLLDAVAELNSLSLSASLRSLPQSPPRAGAHRRGLFDSRDFDALKSAVERKEEENSTDRKVREHLKPKRKSDEDLPDSQEGKEQNKLQASSSFSFRKLMAEENVVTVHTQTGRSNLAEKEQHPWRENLDSESAWTSNDNRDTALGSGNSKCVTRRHSLSNHIDSNSELTPISNRARITDSSNAFPQINIIFPNIDALSSNFAGLTVSSTTSQTTATFPTNPSSIVFASRSSSAFITSTPASTNLAAKADSMSSLNSSAQTRSMTGSSKFLDDGMNDNTGTSGSSGSTGLLWPGSPNNTKG